MKKLCSLFLILLLTLSLVACGEPESTDTLSTDAPPTETVSNTDNQSDTQAPPTETEPDTETEISTDSQDSATSSEEVVLLPVEDGTLKILTHVCTVPFAVKSRIQTKTLSGAWTEELIGKLLQASETGASVEKLSDKKITPLHFEDFAEGLDIDRGTRWILVENVMFRYIKDKEFCKVETYMGDGKEIALSDELKDQLEIALYYAPTNTYLGTWEN